MKIMTTDTIQGLPIILIQEEIFEEEEEEEEAVDLINNLSKIIINNNWNNSFNRISPTILMLKIWSIKEEGVEVESNLKLDTSKNPSTTKPTTNKWKIEDRNLAVIMPKNQIKKVSKKMMNNP